MLHVPAVWPFEFANVLRHLRRRGRMNDHQLAAIIDLSRRLNVTVHAQPPVADLVATAERYDLSAYDAAYLLLALDLRYPVAAAMKRSEKPCVSQVRGSPSPAACHLLAVVDVEPPMSAHWGYMIGCDSRLPLVAGRARCGAA